MARASAVRRKRPWARSPWHDPEHEAANGEDVELAARVLAEARDPFAGIQRRPRRPRGRLSPGEDEAPHPSAAVVAVEVRAAQGRDRGAAVDVAADHAAGAGGGELVVVLEHRWREAGGIAVAGVGAARSLEDP